MEADDRAWTGDLTHVERFTRSPRTHHIFQALRVLEAAFADAPPLGTARRPKDDPIRLGQEPTVAFQRTTITDYRPPSGAGPGKLTNLAFGLFGPGGPLPAHVTEYARERAVNHRDPTLVAFADMLTHRVMGLFYRAWTTGQPAVDFDRGEGGRFDGCVAALAGIPSPALTGRDAMPDNARRHFAAFLSPGPRHPDGLRAILSGFFGMACTIDEFVGCWLDLDPSDTWRLGAAIGLGQGTVIGERVWSRSAKFRIRLGPMSRTDYDRLLPGGDAIARLTAIVRTYAGDALDFEVTLVLREDEVPRACLDGAARLGLTSWVGPRAPGRDADDLDIEPMQIRAAAPQGVTNP
jgi:type VI secretion system protein ImpH